MTANTCTKVNVGLHILRKRPDGYHDMETLFVPYYGFSDKLTIEPAAESSIEIVRKGGVDWDPMQDLTMRAWRLLKADFPQLPNVRIRLEKHAPVGAGLGGGSADAAFALKLLRDIGSLPLSDADLAAYAARLGSDCAFFIGRSSLRPQGTKGLSPQTPPFAAAPTLRPMLGTGKGEILEPFDIDLSSYELRVTVPEGISVSTREAYQEVRPDAGRPALRTLLEAPVEQWKDTVVNDFEQGIFAKHPQIARLKQEFYDSGAIYAAMSGSGSAVFGLFRK